MKNIILIFVILFSINSFSQDETRRGDVELPDFVITGKDVISLRPSKKMNPDFISTLSDNFIKPSFSADDLEIREFSNPLKQEINLLESVPFYNGNLSLEMGRYFIPKADFKYTFLFNNGYFNTKFDGFSKRAHVEKSEEFSINGNIETGYFISNQSSFLPGSEIKAGFDYNNGIYRMFGTNTPDKQRSLVNGDLNFGFRNLMMRNANFGLNLNYLTSSIKEEDFSTNVFNTKFFGDFNFNNFSVITNLNFQKPSTKLDSINSSGNSFINGKGEVGLTFAKDFKVKFGFVYAAYDTSKFLSPVAAVALKLSNGLILFADYSPSGNFIPTTSILEQNRYLTLPNSQGVFFKKKSSINFNIKYEYFRYFGLNFGMKYESFENYPFFKDDVSKGYFTLDFVDTKIGSAYADFLFHLGPYGTFYGNLTATSARDTAEKNIPYIPALNATASYSYSFKNGITAEIIGYFNSERYTSLLNDESLDGYFNLGIKTKYKLSETFYLTGEFMNLLNKEYYEWKNYQGLPLNISFGINYKW